MPLLLLLFCFHCFIYAEEYKQTIHECHQEISQSQGQKRSELLLKLAIIYQKDQQQENSLKAFIQSLDCSERTALESLKPNDLLAYETALSIYLQGTTPQETAIQIREQFASVLERSPENYGLGFLMASCYANLHLFEDFFCCYYRAYQRKPDHFLAHKIKAILYLKLFELSRTLEEREAMRAKIEEYAGKALEIYPQDSSLHKFVIQFASEKNDQVERVLKKIIYEEVSITRSDILFYVQKAIEVKKFELAQQFIDKMRTHYQYSRMLTLAQERLDESKGE